MKKKYLIILFLSFIAISLKAQVTTSPSIPKATDAITVTFDATGTGLAGYTGTVYAYTGVTLNGTRWQNVIASWNSNTTQLALTKISTDLYQLIITPDVTTYYGVTSGTITELDFVFRSADGTKQTSPDIFIPIYASGLNVLITSNNNNDIINQNTTQAITADASLASTLKLYVDNVLQKTVSAATSISSNYTFSATGSHTIKATATLNSNTVTQQISVYVKTPTQTASIPAGMKNGVNKNSNGTVTFVLTAPNKTDVFVLGDFNNWLLNSSYQMKKDTSTNQFWVTISGLNANTEYAYQYDVDYNLIVADPFCYKILDPNNDQYIPSVTYPNLKPYPTGLTTGIVSTFTINKPSFSWNSFTAPSKNNLIIYELLIRDFDVVGTNDIGDFNKATTHLDYLKNLGVNAVELMPVSEFEGNDSWGYNPDFHGALDKAYGTPTAFKTFINECHKRGMAVIMDVVYNHVMGSSPLAQMWWDSTNNRPSSTNPYLNPIAKHPYNVGNDFNHESAYTKTYVKQTLQYWMQEYKIDGFRFDLSKGFTQTNTLGNVSLWGQYDQSRINILEDYANFIWSVNSNEYVILEHFSANSEEKVLANYGMLLWGNLNNNYAQNTMGFSSGSDISWMSYKARGWNNPNVVGYAESHDEERLMYKNLQYGNSSGSYDIKNLATALKREELAANFFYTIPGPKMIWQFGELGYDISINQGGRTSRKPIHWNYFNDANRKKVYDVWSTLANFKKQYPVFNTTNFTLNVASLTKNIVLRGSTMDVVLIGNFDVTPQAVSPNFTKTGIWYEYYTGTSTNITNTSATITLQPGEYRLYSTTQLTSTLGLEKINKNIDNGLNLYPNPVTDEFRLSKESELINIYDISGRLVKQFKGRFLKNKLINIENLAPGVYLLKAKTTNGIYYATKLIKN